MQIRGLVTFQAKVQSFATASRGLSHLINRSLAYYLSNHVGQHRGRSFHGLLSVPAAQGLTSTLFQVIFYPGLKLPGSWQYEKSDDRASWKATLLRWQDLDCSLSRIEQIICTAVKTCC